MSEKLLFSEPTKYSINLLVANAKFIGKNLEIDERIIFKCLGSWSRCGHSHRTLSGALRCNKKYHWQEIRIYTVRKSMPRTFIYWPILTYQELGKQND